MNKKSNEKDKDEPKKPRRPKGDGSFQELPNGKYKVQISIIDEKNKQRRKSFTSSSKTKAIAMLNKFKAEAQNGTLVAPKDTTVHSYVDRWLASRKPHIKEKSYATYEFACTKHIIPKLGKLKMQKVTTAIINDYFIKCGKAGLALSSMSQHRAILSGIMSLAVSEGVIGKNVVTTATSIAKKRPMQYVLSDEQIKKLLEVSRTYKSKKYNAGLHCIYHIILLALATGMRRGEMLALQWHNVDKPPNTIRVTESIAEIKGKPVPGDPKSKNGFRSFNVDPEVIKVLKDDLWTDNGGLVFQANGVAIKFTSLTTAFKNCLELAGISRDVRLHDLRHTHITHLLAEGYDIKMVSERVGDDPETIMRTYAHTIPKKDAEASKFMGSKLFPKE